jgi:hypothetical protein
MSTALVRWNLTEENIKFALIEARGDLFIASQMLGVTALRLHRDVQLSLVLQATLDECSKFAKRDVSKDQLQRAVETRLAVYRVVGLDALHDLATMPIDSNSAQNQVKLAAASRLAGEVGTGSTGNEIAETLRALNDEYHKHAPRIRVTRERMTVETLPPSDEKVISQQ